MHGFSKIFLCIYLTENMEKFILYLILGLFGGLILVLLVIICRLIQTRRKQERSAKMDISEPLPTSPAGMPEDFTLLDNSQESSDNGIEILSINHNRPPPGYHTDTGSRSMNNYYGWLEGNPRQESNRGETPIWWQSLHNIMFLTYVMHCELLFSMFL